MRTTNPILGLSGSVVSLSDTRYVFKLFGFIMIFCSMFVVVFFLVKKAPLYFKEAWNNNKDLIEK